MKGDEGASCSVITQSVEDFFANNACVKTNDAGATKGVCKYQDGYKCVPDYLEENALCGDYPDVCKKQACVAEDSSTIGKTICQIVNFERGAPCRGNLSRDVVGTAALPDSRGKLPHDFHIHSSCTRLMSHTLYFAPFA